MVVPWPGWLATSTVPPTAAIDATSLDNRFAVLAVSVVYQGCAIPVAWAIVPQQQKGQWQHHWLRLLRLLTGYPGRIHCGRARPPRALCPLAAHGITRKLTRDNYKCKSFFGKLAHTIH